ncbi:hypothetical protein F2P81_002406 [Scophthalmus maximus]|uniref:Uncharacterized protein n=1 Tax=Scophthalmus maximus TaxID=52904 RepID=A0A6A4TGQ6_SCOMX|nr:hypothetical protein F2P81_002406 [Scophthalmus maximus]
MSDTFLCNVLTETKKLGVSEARSNTEPTFVRSDRILLLTLDEKQDDEGDIGGRWSWWRPLEVADDERWCLGYVSPPDKDK